MNLAAWRRIITQIWRDGALYLMAVSFGSGVIYCVKLMFHLDVDHFLVGLVLGSMAATWTHYNRKEAA